MACGSFTSDSFTSARSIIVAISNVPAIADAGASRCAPQWLRATRPKTEDQNVLPINRSKMPPIIPNAHAAGARGGVKSHGEDTPASRVHKPHLDEMHGPESLPYRPNRATSRKPSPDDTGATSESRIFQPTSSREAA